MGVPSTKAACRILGDMRRFVLPCLKILGIGDGGAITTSNKKIAAKLMT